MNVEYTGRQYEITPVVRKQIEHGLTKLTKILGSNFETHVILSVEKHRCKAEITITSRNTPIVCAAEAGDMTAAIGEALDRLERQAVKLKARWRTIKRQPKKKWNPETAGKEKEEELRVAVGANVSTAVPVVVHTYPMKPKQTEAHLVNAPDAVSLRPLTVEEAIKEAHFRDRDVFVFRDPQGKVKVLHRTKDGKLELIEAP